MQAPDAEPWATVAVPDVPPLGGVPSRALVVAVAAVSDLLDYPAAAALAGVRETTVRQWKSRHLLTPAGTDERGRLLFRAADVLAADQHTRATPGGRKRTTGGNR